jgi:hypothetical protein
VDINNKRQTKYYDIDMEVDVISFFSNKQHKDVDVQNINTFLPHVKNENNISCLRQFNNFMKNVSFSFNYCCVCDEKTFI